MVVLLLRNLEGGPVQAGEEGKHALHCGRGGFCGEGGERFEEIFHRRGDRVGGRVTSWFWSTRRGDG